MWYRMPQDSLAMHIAAVEELDNTLCAIACAAMLLQKCSDSRAKELGSAILAHLGRAARAARLVASEIRET